MMNTTANFDEIVRVINAEHSDPFSVLGMHHAESGNSLAVRVFIPNADEINVIELSNNIRYKMDFIHEKGLFEVLFKDRTEFFKYCLEVKDNMNNIFIVHDPYSFLPVLPDFDIHLFNEGNNHKIYEKLGAHIMSIDGIEGSFFAVWAPCAKRVSVVGDFNQWDGRRHTMRIRGSSGIWEIFIPRITEGEIYKYEIKTPHNDIYVKADPYGFYSELRPNTAKIFSIIKKF